MDKGLDRKFVHFEIMGLRTEFGMFIPMPYYNTHDDDLHCPIEGSSFRSAYVYAEHYATNHPTVKKEADARAKARREKRKERNEEILNGEVPTEVPYLSDYDDFQSGKEFE
jgi:hypothetical protein